MAAVVGVSITTPKVFAKLSDSSKPHPLKFSLLNSPWKKCTTQFSHGRMYVRPVAAAPDQISDKVEQSIKNAKEACSDDPVSGECAAAWDEVEELSAAASHARDKQKESDPLENYCKDNPETDECRTYDN
ncbi:UNVERIFIED_CONTAM: Calvin cycle protein CP12-1, chloroplastic [Sesamum latifolium]|uniref:Calvin cycle protein CP12-1, chloroplastic n=1 Tax=Sesamum latifolium TaxID=2727402 RepID=A0AAW2Y208_9LAMI